TGLFTGFLTYSDGTTADLDEADLSENAGLCLDFDKLRKQCEALYPYSLGAQHGCEHQYNGTPAGRCLPAYYLRYRCTNQPIAHGTEETRASGIGAIDWNCDGQTTQSGVVG